MPSDLDIWDPFKPMRRVRRRMSDFFNLWPEEFSAVREPLVDVVDKGKSLQLVAELPGIDKRNIEINVQESSVEIRAESKAEASEEKEKEGYYFRERTYQRFFRRVPLPTEVIAGRSKAEFKNGILILDLPKKHPKEKAKGFKVEVR